MFGLSGKIPKFWIDGGCAHVSNGGGRIARVVFGLVVSLLGSGEKKKKKVNCQLKADVRMLAGWLWLLEGAYVIMLPLVFGS